MATETETQGALLLSSLRAYYDQLKAHDWGYEYSDDQGVWAAGVQERERLVKTGQLSPRHSELFIAFRAHHLARNNLESNPPSLPKRP